MVVKIEVAIKEDARTLADFNIKHASEVEHMRIDPEVALAGVMEVLNRPALGKYWVAKEDGKAVGMVGIAVEWSDWRCKEGWILESVFVHEDYRRRGIFKQLYSTVKEAAKAQGNVFAIRLYVFRSNDVGKKTYEKLGFDESEYLLMQARI